jgi:hypothetical protein
LGVNIFCGGSLPAREAQKILSGDQLEKGTLVCYRRKNCRGSIKHNKKFEKKILIK